MRLALVSDIHGNLPALEAVVADIRARGVARVANLGDHLSGPLWPRETADLLVRLDWTAIAGNHDRELVHEPAGSHAPSNRYAWQEIGDEHKDWLRALPSVATVFDEGKLLLVHGTPSDDTRYLLEEIEDRPNDRGRLRLASAGDIASRLGAVDAPVVACGHSHVPRLVTLPSGPTIVNPGSVGLPAFEAVPGPHVSETGAPHARYAIVERAGGRSTVTFVAVEYDWASAAARADANGRPDWAEALGTGFAPRRRP